MIIGIKRKSRVWAAICLAIMAACSPPEIVEEEIRVAAEDNGLSVRNGRSTKVYYFGKYKPDSVRSIVVPTT